MTIYKKTISECNYKKVALIFPIIRTVVDRNEWITNPYDPLKGIEIKFNTHIIVCKDSTYMHVEIALFGFGIIYVNQNGY